MNKVLSVAIAAFIAVGASSFGPSVAFAASTDTPETVMAVGKNVNEQLNAMATIAKEAKAIASRMAKDKKFATQLLELAQKDDKAGIVKLFKKHAPKSEMTIEEISDFSFRVNFKIGKFAIDVCYSNENAGCD